VNVGPLDRWLLRAHVHSQHSLVAVGNEYAADAKRNAQCAHAKASCKELPRGREEERGDRGVERRSEGEVEKRTERSVEGARGGGGLDGQLSQLLLNAAREGKVEMVRRILQSHEIPPDTPLLTADSAHPLTLLEGTTAWWKEK